MEMKVCTKCGVEKALGEFHFRKDTKKHRGQCKECMAASSTAWYHKNKPKQQEYHKAYHRANAERITRYRRERYYEDTDKGIEAASKWATENPERKREISRGWKKRHAEAISAMAKVQRAVASGALVRTPCVLCGSEDMIEGHHQDYSKPLQVDWLCHKHHQAIHAAVREVCRIATRKAS